MIVGGPGAGKSTFARTLGEKTGLPVFYMDQIHWLPGWVERPTSEKNRMTHEVHTQPRWIFEGGNSATYAERLARAETLIWLDLPLPLRLWRVLRRWASFRGRTRPDLPENCPERLNLEFIWFILRTSAKHRRRHVEILRTAPPHLTCHRLNSRRRIARYLSDV